MSRHLEPNRFVSLRVGKYDYELGEPSDAVDNIFCLNVARPILD